MLHAFSMFPKFRATCSSVTGCRLSRGRGPAKNWAGLKIDTASAHPLNPEQPVRNAWTVSTPSSTEQKRTAERHNVAVPARLTWKDQYGTTRFASVITRNVSEFGVYVECHSPISIPLYRLVQFQLERDVRDADGLPQSLRQGRALS